MYTAESPPKKALLVLVVHQANSVDSAANDKRAALAAALLVPPPRPLDAAADVDASFSASILYMMRTLHKAHNYDSKKKDL